jgi:H+/Cl- antiporter ClcA
MDSTFRKKHSYNFDMMKAEVFVNRETQSAGWMWLGYFFVGFFVGCIAFIMELFENSLVDLRDRWTLSVLESTNNS